MISCPKISVIVPVYNVEQYLPKCIESILNQTFSDFELLLIDDESKDNSGNICDEYAAKDARIRVFHKENGGVSSARNIGLDNAKGEWITFCDSDDWVKVGFLECFNRLSKESDAELLSQGYYCENFPNIGATNVCLDDCVIEKDEIYSFIFKLEKAHLLGFLWCKAFRTELIKSHMLHFNEQYVLMEDEEFILRYLKYADKLINTHESFYIYKYSEINKKFGIQNTFELNISRYISLSTIKNNAGDQALIAKFLIQTCLRTFMESIMVYNKFQRIKYSKFIGDVLFDSFYLYKGTSIKTKGFIRICKFKNWKWIVLCAYCMHYLISMCALISSTKNYMMKILK